MDEILPLIPNFQIACHHLAVLAEGAKIAQRKEILKVLVDQVVDQVVKGDRDLLEKLVVSGNEVRHEVRDETRKRRLIKRKDQLFNLPKDPKS